MWAALAWAAGSGAALWLLHVYLTWHFAFWRRRGVASVEALPLLGSLAPAMLGLRHEAELFRDHYRRFPDHRFVGGFRIRQPYLMIRDLDLVKHVTVKDFEHFHDRGYPPDEVRRPLSTHLFNLQGRRWRALRAKLTPAFTSGKMKLMFNLMAECVATLTKHLDAKAERREEIEMREALAQYTTDVIGSCALGVQTNAMSDPEDAEGFRSAGRAAVAPSMAAKLRRTLVSLAPRLASALGVAFESSATTAFFTRAAREVVQMRERTGVTRGDFIDLLLQLKRRGKVDKDSDDEADGKDDVVDDIAMTDNLLAAQVWVFFIAGFDTSSSAASFAIHELALNPDLQERARAEADKALAENGGKFTYDAIKDLKYIEMVLFETLRKYSPLPDIVRMVTKEYTIPGTDIRLPKGLKVHIPTWGIHYDPNIYPDPERFDPERFSEEEKAKRHHYAFLPFGEGPRVCIGMRFGMQQSKLALAALLARYRFSPCSRTQVPVQLEPTAFFTAPRGGLWLTIQPR